MESRTAPTGGAALSLDGGMWKGGRSARGEVGFQAPGRSFPGRGGSVGRWGLCFLGRGGRMFGQWRKGRFSAHGKNAGRPSLLKGRDLAAVPSPLPLEGGGTGCPWTCKGGNSLFPVPDSGHGPFLQKKREAVLCCEGGRLRGRMFGRWRGAILCTQEECREPSLLKGRNLAAVPSPLPLEREDRMPLDVPGENGLFPSIRPSGVSLPCRRRGVCPPLWRREAAGADVWAVEGTGFPRAWDAPL